MVYKLYKYAEILLSLHLDLIVFRMEQKRKDFVYGYEAAARILQVSPNTVANYVRQGKLEGCYNRLSPRKIAFSREKLEQKVWGNIC